jgi:hypothetical protein
MLYGYRSSRPSGRTSSTSPRRDGAAENGGQSTERQRRTWRGTVPVFRPRLLGRAGELASAAPVRQLAAAGKDARAFRAPDCDRRHERPELPGKGLDRVG